MKNGLLLLVCSFLFGLSSQAQVVQVVTVNPVPTLDCSTTVITIGGQLNCINATILGTTHSIVGNTIFVDVNIDQPPICLPALGTFSEMETVGNIPPGTYTVTGRAFQNGVLFSSLSQPLTVGSCCPTNGNFVAADDKFCPGETGSFDAVDPGLPSYTWYVNGVVTGGNTAQFMYTFPTPGSYDISLKADDGVCSDSTFQTVTVGNPAIQFGTITKESCEGSQDGGAAVSVSGGFSPYMYSWSNGSMTQNLNQVSTGMYTLTVTDSEGCMTEDSVSVGLDTAVTVAITSPLNLNYCAGDTLQLLHTQSGATSIQWLLDGQLFAIADTIWVPTSGSMYDIQVIATDGVCTDSMDVNAMVADSLKLSSLISGESCVGDMDGAIDLSTSGGQAPFNYSWSHGPTSEDVMGLDTGQYVVDIMDEAGCMATDTFQITTLGGITAGFTFTTADTLAVFSDISTPGAASWSWDFGDGSAGSTAMNPTHTFADSGFYGVCLTVTDSFGCMDTFCENVEISIAVGLFEAEVQALTIAPNPASELIEFLHMPIGLERAQVRVHDALGRVVMVREGLSEPTLPIANLAKGLYTVDIQLDGQRWSGKFLKQ